MKRIPIQLMMILGVSTGNLIAALFGKDIVELRNSAMFSIFCNVVVIALVIYAEYKDSNTK